MRGNWPFREFKASGFESPTGLQNYKSIMAVQVNKFNKL